MERTPVQVWDVSQSVDTPQGVCANPEPHAFTSMAWNPDYTVIAAGDSSGVVCLMQVSMADRGRQSQANQSMAI